MSSYTLVSGFLFGNTFFGCKRTLAYLLWPSHSIKVRPADPQNMTHQPPFSYIGATELEIHGLIHAQGACSNPDGGAKVWSQYSIVQRVGVVCMNAV